MTKILILGGGFGGIRCALDLEKKINLTLQKPCFWRKVSRSKASVTLVDKNSYHLFVPALYEVASAYGIKQDPFAVRLKKTICVPYSDIFENKKIKFIQAEISSIDVENKKTATRGGEILDYDYLVIALGSQSADFGIPGVKEYAFKFKTLEDGLALNQKIDQLTKEIAAGKRQPPVKMAVIGAGFTGIEVAAELACCVKKFAKACNIKSRCERIMLFEAAPKILPVISDEERKIITQRLTKLGVELVEGTAAEEIRDNYIKLKNGKTIEADLVMWTAGTKPLDILSGLPSVALTENKKIKVNQDMSVNGLYGVFAVGDNSEFTDSKTGRAVPALAYVAVDQGKIIAKNILRLINNKKPLEYQPSLGAWITPVGGKYALAHLFRKNIRGFWGWVIREAVDFKYMLSILPVRKAISLFWQEITLFTRND